MTLRLTIPLNLCFVLTVCLAMSACMKREATLKDADLAGVYALVSVSGNPVPGNVTHEGAALQVLSGTLAINADGTCSTKTVFIPPSGAAVEREVSATYIKDGSKLTMQWKDAGSTVGTIQGSTFTMDNEGMVFVYRK